MKMRPPPRIRRPLFAAPLLKQNTSGSRPTPGEADLTMKAAIGLAFGHRSYILLVSGFFVCGFQLAFITVHMPAYLAEHGIIVEKTGLYSFFIMVTIGITKGRWNSLVTELQQFKDDYDNNRPLWRILPAFVGKYPQYEKVGLRDLCSQIHGVYKANDIARLTTEMYLSNMEPAMRPADAWAKLAASRVQQSALDLGPAADELSLPV